MPVMDATHDQITLDQIKQNNGTLRCFLSRLPNYRQDGSKNGSPKYRAKCPFHSDSTPSFDVYYKLDGELRFKCWGCGEGGDVFQFVQNIDNLSFPDAIARIKDEIGHDGGRRRQPAPEPKPQPKPETKIAFSLAAYADAEKDLASSQSAKDWLLNERGITYETAQRLHLGYRQVLPQKARNLSIPPETIDKGWITIPHIKGNQVLLIQYRSLVAKARARLKGMVSYPFNLQAADRGSDLYLVSGPFDAAILVQAGLNAISLVSDTVGIDDVITMLPGLIGCGRLILAGDNDPSGQKVMVKIQAVIPGSLLLQWPVECKDANDLWLKHRVDSNLGNDRDPSINSLLNDLAGFRQVVQELTKQALPAPAPAPDAVPDAASELIEDETETLDDVPVCPPEIIDGGYIGDLTRLLTDGTTIPPEFVWLNCAMLLGAMIDGKVGLSGHSDIHTRLYAMNVSVQSRTGKGESWKRTGEDNIGLLGPLLEERGIVIIDGGLFGSGEYMVGQIAAKAQQVQKASDGGVDTTKRVDIVARFDEMTEVFEKSKALGSTLGPKLLMMFERDTVSTGSFKNEKFVVSNLHFSLSGDFTRAGFEKVFAGQGARGSGLLSRCIYTLARKRPYINRWPETNSIEGVKVFRKIKACLDRLAEQSDTPVGPTEEPDSLFYTPPATRFIVPETDAARVMIDQFLRDLDNEDDGFTPELATHFKRYLILQSVFSDNQVVDETRVKQGILWTRNQLAIRQVLWPEDAGAPTEQFEQKIRKVLADKGPQSLTKLIDRCHVRRPGSGGTENFLRAINSLTKSSEINVAGRTQRGVALYSVNHGAH
jgi:hypothetical protein